MDLEEVRNRYLKFFEHRGHTIVPSSSLVPTNDPTTLFTGAGMQPMLPYLLGNAHPSGKRIVDSQKCFRAEDIEEVGDNRHTTFFEMLGNWSLGEYYKKEQLEWFFEFLTKDLGLPAEKLYVTVFSGDPELHLPRDSESAGIWKDLFKTRGIDAALVDIGTIENGGKFGAQGGRIFYYDASKNWWSRSGKPSNMPVGEPGGPDSEVFFEFKHIIHDPKFGQYCHPNCDCGRFMEIGNSVFMEYKKTENGSFIQLPQKNVDFGGGLERITAALLDCSDIFKINVFKRVVAELEKASGYNYDRASDSEKRSFRIMADHLRAAVFMVADGILPSNKERGYILRRLIRRALLNGNKINIKETIWISILVNCFADVYGDFYNEIGDNRDSITKTLSEEADKFYKTLESGLRQFEKIVNASGTNIITAEEIFDLYQSYGFPEELSVELAKEKQIIVDENELATFRNKHKDLSRSSTQNKFKGGLADTSEMSVKYHTATHLLNAALRNILGDHVYQKGSNITPLRLRFDFPNPEKLTAEQINKIEALVNQKIKEALPVTFEQIKFADTAKLGVIGVFGEKYPEIVTVYRIGTSETGYFSQEICGGPHVTNTSKLGKFRIVKEDAVSAGVRRIKAVLE